MNDSPVEVVVAVVRNEATGKLLALRKAASYREQQERYQANPWEFPGGKIEDGETPEAAAERELAEETALDGTAVATGETYTRTHGDTQYRFHPVLVETDEIDAALSQEHEAYRWLKKCDVSARATMTEQEAVERVMD